MPLDDMVPLGSFQPHPHPHPSIPYTAPHNAPPNQLHLNFEHLQTVVPIAPQSHPVSFLPNPVPPQSQLYPSSSDYIPSNPVFATSNLSPNRNLNLANGRSIPPVHLLNQSVAVAKAPSLDTLSITPQTTPDSVPPHRPQLRVIAEKATRPHSISALEKKRLIAERIKKASATRKRNRAAKQRQQELEQAAAAEMRRRPDNHPNGAPETVVVSDDVNSFKVGDKVMCRPSDRLGQELAEIVLVTEDQLYVHFEGRDRRMDRWIPKNEVTPARHNPHNIDTYSPAASHSVKLTRSKSRQLQERNPVSEKETGNEAVARAEREREEKTKVKNVAKLVFGCYQLDAWYFSPFPIAPPSVSSASEPNSIKKDKYSTVDCMYMCQYCLIYGKSLAGYAKHKRKCQWEHPPGYRIYQDPNNDIAVYEIDGMVNVGYCQRLTLLGKLFLDHKTLFFDVSPFLFYVVTIGGEVGGFFSKEKPERKSEFNLACLLTLPHHQKKGLGRFLIELSYTLSRCEGKIGSPERPLSDLGQVSYRSFWTYEILKYAREAKKSGSIEVPVGQVAEDTGIRVQDVTQVLKTVNLLKIWKGDQSMNLHNTSNLEKLWRSAKKGKIPVQTRFLIIPNAFGIKKQNNTATKKKNRNINHSSSIHLPPAIYRRPGTSTPSLSAIGKKRSRPPKNDRDSLSPSHSRRGTSRQKLSTPRTHSALPFNDIPSLNGFKHGNNSTRRILHPTSPPAANSTPATPRLQKAAEPLCQGTSYYDELTKFCIGRPEKVLIENGHPDALPRENIEAFALSVDKPLHRVVQDLRTRAQQMLIEKHIPTTFGNTNVNTSSRKRPGSKDVHLVARALSYHNNNNMSPHRRHNTECMPSASNTSPLKYNKNNYNNTSAQSPRKPAALNNNNNNTSTPRKKRVSGIIRKTVNGNSNTTYGAEEKEIKEEPRSRNNSSSPPKNRNKQPEVIDLISDDDNPAGSVAKVSSQSPTTTTNTVIDELVNNNAR